MKILAIGDFHGKFPLKLQKIAKKSDIDLILSQGDYCGNKELEKLFFKYAYGTNRELWEFIGKRKVEQLDKKNFEVGIKVLKKLNSLNKIVIGITGNWDPTHWPEVGFSDSNLELRRDKFSLLFNKKIKNSKNIKIVDFKNYKFLNYNFVGYPRSTYPGRITHHIREKIKRIYNKKANRLIKRIKEDNKKFYGKLKKEFTDNTIFISHNCPYNTKLDILKKGPQKGRHYGSYLAKKIISELKPKFAVCGHIHENQGKQKIGKTLVINPGAAYEGKAAIIDINKTIKVKFIK